MVSYASAGALGGSSGYNYPAPAAPESSYLPPQQTFSAPTQQYLPPQQTYSAPAPQYSAPAPAPQYAAPAPSYSGKY